MCLDTISGRICILNYFCICGLEWWGGVIKKEEMGKRARLWQIENVYREKTRKNQGLNQFQIQQQNHVCGGTKRAFVI